MSTFHVTCGQTGQEALEYFNGFHDGFMQRIVISSRDRIESDLSQTCSGLFEVEIDFAHYNYAASDAPFHHHDQIVRAIFYAVRNIRLELTHEFLGNTIISLRITAAGERLELWRGRHAYLAEQQRYEYREPPLFSFESATFTEVASTDVGV